MLEKLFEGVSRKTLKWSNYFAIYEQLFASRRGATLTFVEVGVMNGGSLQMWREYFGASARIIGVDFNPAARALESEGFEIFIGDQSDPEFWRSFFAKVGRVDVLLDDGGHTNLQQIGTVIEAVSSIRDGGMIVTEDTHASYLRDEFGNPSRYSFIEFAKRVVDLTNSRNPRVPPFNDAHSLAGQVYSVAFYDSVVVFHIDRRLATRPALLSAGTIAITDTDFRHQSAATEVVSTLRGRYRTAPAWLQVVMRPGKTLILSLYSALRRARIAVQNRRARRYFR